MNAPRLICAAALALVCGCHGITAPTLDRGPSAPLLRRDADPGYWVYSDPYLDNVLFPDPVGVELENNGRDFTITVRWAQLPEGYRDGWRAYITLNGGGRDASERTRATWLAEWSTTPASPIIGPTAETTVRYVTGTRTTLYGAARIRRDGQALRFSCSSELAPAINGDWAVTVTLHKDSNGEIAWWQHIEEPMAAAVALR